LNSPTPLAAIPLSDSPKSNALFFEPKGLSFREKKGASAGGYIADLSSPHPRRGKYPPCADRTLPLYLVCVI